MRNTGPWIWLGSIFAFLAVAFGAFGAHALKERLSERALAIYQTAAQYQMAHALALIAFGLWRTTQPSVGGGLLSVFSGWAFCVGICLFSGSLYALAITDVKILGAITPLGGLSFLAGWLAFAIAAFQARGTS